MASLASGDLIAVGVVVAVVFFVWGWSRAARFRAKHGKPPWSIPPWVWGVLNVVLLPIAWILYAAATRSTTVSDLALAHASDVVIADTAEERERLTKIVGELPLLRPPQPDTRGWHPDPLHERGFRFFDGQRWTREVSDDPTQQIRAAVGDPEADLKRRLQALPPPQDTAPSWHVDPLGTYHFRYFDGHAWTEEVREARKS